MTDTGSCLLTKQNFREPESLPEWVSNEYKTFDKVVTHKTFPCTFGLSAQTRGELRYSYITHKDWSHLPATLQAFNKLFDDNKRNVRYGFFLFVEPEKKEKSLEYYREYFWKVLQYLHDHDEEPWPDGYPKDPDHYLWS